MIRSKNELKELFLSKLNDNNSDIITEFSKRLTKISNEVDVMMFMARKSVCLAESLKVIGLSRYNCLTTSQRVLDMKADWLKGKRVALIDDAVITGTSIAKAKKSLEDLGCSVEIHVVCVNLKYWCKKLVDPILPYYRLTDAECAEFCSELVEAMAMIPLAYTTDFPTFTNINLTDNQMERLLISGRWSFVDHATNEQRKFNVDSKTFYVDPYWQTSDFEFEKSTFTKVRMFSRKKYSGKGCWVSVVPIKIVPPISSLSLNIRFELMMEEFSNFGFSDVNDYFRNLDCRLTEEEVLKSKLRFVHYYESYYLGIFFLKEVEQLLGVKITPKLSEYSLGYLFPPLVGRCMENYIKVKEKGRIFHKTKIVADDINTTDYFKRKIINALSLENSFNEIFYKLYTDLEIPARKIAKKYSNLSKNVFEAASRDELDILNRLDKGLSYDDLVSSVQKFGVENEDAPRVVSILLDRSIDRGIVVPTTCYDGEVAYRGFRHGEDVPFGRSEKVLLHKMLESYQLAKNGTLDGSIPGIEVEKSCVLTVQSLIKTGHYKKTNYNILGESNTIGIRYSLHGAVLAVKSEYIYEAFSENCIRNILVEAKVLKPLKKSKNEYGRFQVRPWKSEFNISSQKIALSEAGELGALFGYLRFRAAKRSNKLKISQNDFIVLTTCSSTRDVCGALAGELNIISSKFDDYKPDLIKYLDGSEKYPDFVRANRNLLQVALNSGYFKLSSWKNNIYSKIINRLSKDFNLVYSQIRSDVSQPKEIADLVYVKENSFKKFFGDFDINNYYSAPVAVMGLLLEVASLLLRMRIDYIAYEICLYMIYEKKLYWRNEDDKIVLSNPLNDYIKTCKLWRKVGADGNPDIYKFQNYISDDVYIDPYIVARSALENISHIIRSVDPVLWKVNAVIPDFGKHSDPISYPFIMVIDFDFKDISCSKTRYEIVNAIEKRIFEFVSRRNKTVRPENIRVLPIDSQYKDESLVTICCTNAVAFEFLLMVFSSIERNIDFGFRSYLAVNLDDPFKILSVANSSECYGRGFWLLFKELRSEIRKNYGSQWAGKCFFTMQSDKPIPKSALNYLKEVSGKNDKKILLGTDVGQADCAVSVIKTNSGVMSMNRINVDVAVITVVPTETRALTDVLKQYPGVSLDKNLPGTVLTVNVGSLPSSDGHYHSVVNFYCLDQGQANIGATVKNCLTYYNPSLIVLLGMSGKIHEKGKLGDVNVSSWVLDSDRKSEEGLGVKHNPVPLPPMQRWIRNIWTRLQNMHGEELQVINDVIEENNTFNIYIRPTLSGSSVVKDECSESKLYAEKVDRKLINVETEATVFITMVDDESLVRDSRLSGYLHIRGFQDSAGSKKEEERINRYRSSSNAAVALKFFLKSCTKNFVNECPVEINMENEWEI